MTGSVVIVGASVAGVKTAQALRSEGYAGEITLVDAENVAHAYDKPPLSKGFLTGENKPENIRLLGIDELERLDAEFRWGSAAVSLDITDRRVRLASGEELTYDVLVIATGARARPSPWTPHPKVVVLRTAEDADRLRRLMKPGGALSIIGSGFVGAEVAATAIKLGLAVTLIDPFPAPMSRVLNAEVGSLFKDKHELEGVRTVFGVGVSDLKGSGESVIVELTNGAAISADVVLVGIGAVVNTEWLTESGLLLEDGVVCDPTLKAIGAPSIYAVGDVARWRSDPAAVEDTRLEHWTNAVDQARVVAHNIVHQDDARAYSPLEYVWSDQFDWKIQVVGRTGATDHQIAGSAESGRIAVTYSDDGVRFTGAVLVNWPRALVLCRRSLADGRPVGDVRAELDRLLAGVPAAATGQR
jgi:NADPH-dependent 2,4-dienoyl-CoA reductase/sulfur reductase-like enzyme